ncbi:hypothetical protein OTUT144_1490 [Orientia tsutsugamushi str. UT144]|uniref:Uncharacterized protein n=1 Tax=Orientia tsutsugamushi str. UT144 TaxID=1441384 RepID=A0A0F3RMM2_ORITS|nr:hypothetical protein OTUT144_1490 [Orientia tsutsugamushi str. UT144]
MKKCIITVDFFRNWLRSSKLLLTNIEIDVKDSVLDLI